MITLDDGLIMTWRFPRFSALYMLLRASFRTLTRTIVTEKRKTPKVQVKNAQNKKKTS